ncbi:MAG: hypothetical protein ACXWV8_02485 [Chitinophagaceae bacterium]
MKTWLLCEASVHAETISIAPRYKLVKECSDCAKACFAVVSRLVSDAGNLGDLVLNCLLHCRQCSKECSKYPGEQDLLFCSMVSSICADTLKEIAVNQLN